MYIDVLFKDCILVYSVHRTLAYMYDHTNIEYYVIHFDLYPH